MQLIGRLFESNALARSACAHAVCGGINHFLADEFRQRIKHRTGQHIAAGDGFVFQNAVVEQIDCAPIMYA